MKKLLICAVGLIFCLFLASCAANKEESSKAKSPTGYPANQVQNDCIMYNGVLYFQGTGSEKSPRMQRKVGR